MKSIHKYTVAALILAVSSPSFAAEINTAESEDTFGDVKFKFTTGVDYSEGDYGQSKDTKITYKL
jgi:hypothetical protein